MAIGARKRSQLNQRCGKVLNAVPGVARGDGKRNNRGYGRMRSSARFAFASGKESIYGQSAAIVLCWIAGELGVLGECILETIGNPFMRGAELGVARLSEGDDRLCMRPTSLSSCLPAIPDLDRLGIQCYPDQHFETALCTPKGG